MAFYCLNTAPTPLSANPHFLVGYPNPVLPLFPMVSDMAKTCIYAAIIVCACAKTCLAYRLVGSEALSDALVAHHYTINDRLDAVIVVDPTIPTFEYQTFYAMGSADEPEGEQGMLHFLEHIIAGTGNLPTGELNRLIERNGGEHQASTGHHMTYFTMRFPRNKLALAVEIDRDRYYSTLINKEVVEDERRIVLTEHSSRVTNRQRRFFNQMAGITYGKEGFDALGPRKFINGIENGELKQFFHNVLRRKRRLIVVIGDIELGDILAKLSESFPDGRNRKGGESPIPRFPNPDALGERFNVKFKGLGVSRLLKTWRVPPIGNPDHASFRILASILNRPSNSLRTSLLDSQVVDEFSVGVDNHRGFSLMVISVEMPGVTSTDAIEAEIEDELRKIETNGIPETDLLAARSIQLRQLYSEFSDRSRMAYRFGDAFAHDGDPLHYPRLIRDIESVNTRDVKRNIGQYLAEDNSITLSWTSKETPWTDDEILGAIVLFVALGSILFGVIWVVRRGIPKSTPETVDDDETHKYHF